MIPRKLHVIWIGDEAEFPEECVNTWRNNHAEWDLTIWGNEALRKYEWRCGDQMRELLSRDLRGVTDCMRWNILYNEGGVVVDADMVSLRSLPDWLLECQIAVPWLNEIAYPGLLSTVIVAAEPFNPLVGEIILRIQSDPELSTKQITDATGAGLMLQLRNQHNYRGMTLLPSHFFLPRLPKIEPYNGTAPIYAYKKCYASMGSRSYMYQPYSSSFKPGRIDLELNGPVFTVGIPNYNRGEYIGEAITSVLEQDYGRFELLIVDDGSTDNSEKVVASFDDPRIRFVKKEHSGIPRTANRLLNEARGSHVVWMGNDDILMPGLLREYALLLQTWPEVVFAYGDLIKIDSAGNEIGLLTYSDFFGDRFLLTRFLISNVVPGPGSMTNVGVVRAIGGFDNDIPFCIDYDLWGRLSATGLPFKHIGRPTCKYRMHNSNISNRTDDLVVDELYILKKMLSSFDLAQICADFDWANDPKRAEVQACERIVTLLSRKNDLASSQLWEKRKQTMQENLDN